jgi:FlaA1/EpsC-like NDP-sugar epimerase
MFLISITVFYIAGLYEKQTRPTRSVMGIRIFGAQAATVAVAAILFFVLPLSIAPKTILIIYLIVSVAAESTWRFYRMNREMKESNRVSALLIGSGQSVLELYNEVNGNNRCLIRFVDHQEATSHVANAMWKAIISNIANGVRVIVIDTSNPATARHLPQLYDLMADGVIFLEFSSLYEEIFDRVPLDHLDAVQLL